MWPLLIWSLGLYFHAVAALPTRGPNFERTFAGWCEQRAKRSTKEAAKQAEVTARIRKSTTRQAAEAELDE